jgi:hypothetical protein
VAGLFCVNNVCQKKPIGTACGANGECANSNCVDGYCCDSACNTLCEYCGRAAAPGICGPMPVNFDPKSPFCGGYECDGTAFNSCPPATCSNNNSCRLGYTCQQGSCQVCKMTGSTCSQAQANACCSGVCFNFQCN